MKRIFYYQVTGVFVAVLLILPIAASRALASVSESAINYALPSGADPWGTRQDSKGNTWVAVPGCDPNPNCAPGTAPGSIEVFNTASRTWTQTYQLPSGYGQPLFLAIDGSGNVWFPMFQTNSLGMLNTTTGVFSQWIIPTANAGAWDITIDHNGMIWLTEHYLNQIARFNPSTHAFTEFVTPTANSLPYGITVDAHNNIWFTENNPSVAQIGEYTSGEQLLEYKIRTTLPGSSLTPHLLAVDPNGNVWWTEGFVGMIGRLSVSQANPGTTNGVSEFQYPTICNSCGTHTSGIDVDSNGVVWFDDSLQNMYGAFPDSGTQQFTVFSAPSAGAHTHDGLSIDSNNNILFSEEFAGKLAVATQSQGATPPVTTVGVTVARDTFTRTNQSYSGTASDGNVWSADSATNNTFSISW